MELTAPITYTLLFVALYIEVFLLLAYLDSSDEQQEGKAMHAPLPRVCIIVPCFNEAETVRGTISSLLALDYPKQLLSIIAVNDGSTDATPEVLASYQSHAQVQVLHKENGGKHSAMNLALQHTDADVIGCLDADSYVDPLALRASMKRLQESDAAAVTPAIVAHNPDNWLRFIQQAEYALSVFMRRALAASDAVFITPGPFSLFRRDVILELGGWRHAHGTEDMDIAMRLQQQGYRIVNAPQSRVFTKTPHTLQALYRQRVRWTYGFLMNTFDQRHMLFNRGYGALGVIILPTALISIASALYFSFMVIVEGLSRLYHYYVKVSLVGFDLTWSMPTTLFFINTTMVALITYTLITLALTLLFLGRSMADIRLHPASVPLYLVLYSFIAPLWLTGAVVRATLRTQAPWR